MTIHVEDLTFDVIIGLLDFERDKPQRVIVNLQAFYDYSDDAFIDYGDIVLLIHDTLKTKRYKLLENALLGLKEVVHTTYPHIDSLFIKISKPDIIPQCNVSLSEAWDF